MSTSIALETCAEVSSERAHVRAMTLRHRATSARTSRRRRRARRGGAAWRRCGGGCGAGAAAAGAAAAGAAARQRPPRALPRVRAPPARMRSTSFFVTRPPRPVPGDCVEVEAVLGDDARDDRRDERALVAALAVAVARRRGGALRRADDRHRRVRRVGGGRGRDVAEPRPGASRGRRGPPRRRRGLGRRRGRGSGLGAATGRRRRRPVSITASACRPRPSRPRRRGSRAPCRRPGDGTSVSTLSVEISSERLVRLDRARPPACSQRGDRALGDGDAHLGHHDVDERFRWPSVLLPLRSVRRELCGCACDDVVDLRDERLLERRRERHRRVGRGEPHARARRGSRTPPRAIVAAISAPKPPVRVSSCSTSTLRRARDASRAPPRGPTG